MYRGSLYLYEPVYFHLSKDNTQKTINGGLLFELTQIHVLHYSKAELYRLQHQRLYVRTDLTLQYFNNDWAAYRNHNNLSAFIYKSVT